MIHLPHLSAELVASNHEKCLSDVKDRQVQHKEKYPIEHDALHSHRELRDCAVCFLNGSTSVKMQNGMPLYGLWPFQDNLVKIMEKIPKMSYRQRLVEATALLMSELERETLAEEGYMPKSEEPLKNKR